MLIGLLYGLGSASIWAVSSLMVKAQAARIDTLSFNAFRIIVGALFFIALLLVSGGVTELIAMPPVTAVILALSVLLGFCVGDSIYFWSMTEIGASRAMPLSGIYPLFTWMLAVPLLGEKITIPALVGTILILIALYLLGRESPDAGEGSEFILAAPDATPGIAKTNRLKYIAVGAAIFAAFMWACSTTLLRIGLSDESSVIVVSAFRMTVGGLFLFPIVQRLKGARVWHSYTRSALPKLIALAVFSTGIGSLLFVNSVVYNGAARAALINSTSPLIGVALAAIFLSEPITRRVAVGTVIALGGVWLILG